MTISSVSISNAAATLHPNFHSALRQSGVDVHSVASADTIGILAVGEPAPVAGRFVRVGRARIPALSIIPEPGCLAALSFDADDLDFTAALIASIVRGIAPAAVAPASQTLLQLASRVAASDVSVLISGATGTRPGPTPSSMRRSRPAPRWTPSGHSASMRRAASKLP